MKKIGLIGGMSWESTLLYYKLLNEKVKSIRGGFHSPNCVIESVDFSKIAELQAKDEWDALHELMTKRAGLLQNSGAEMILICANTMHLSVPAIERSTNIPVIHIAKATAEKIVEKKLKKVSLLGTKYTMEKDFFKDTLTSFGIETIIPDEEDRNEIHRIIYNELSKGELKSTSKENYINIINKQINSGAEGIILGCTEIPLLINQEDVVVPVFDTTKIHATAAYLFSII